MMMLMIYMKCYKTLILRQIQTKYGRGLLSLTDKVGYMMMIIMKMLMI